MCARAAGKRLFDDGHAPPVVLESTAEITLKVIPLEDLQAHAIPNLKPVS